MKSKIRVPSGIVATKMHMFCIAAVVIFVAVAASAFGVYKSEGFANYMSPSAYPNAPSIGAEDNKVLTPDNGSTWRGPSPNEPLTGSRPSGDGLYLFYNNQCKPECCPSSLSCGTGGGCVCTTEADRAFINGRGGNRTQPYDL